MDDATKNLLFEAWAYCDEEDKSTDFMFQYMADTANVDYDDVVDFVISTSSEERAEWYKNR